MKKWLGIILLLGLPLISWADVNNYGAESDLRQGAGARAGGMGGAFIALADDATAGYWNPAGLSQMELEIYQAAFQHGLLTNNASTSFLSYAFLWPNVGEFSISWFNFYIGNIETRDENGNILGQVSVAENAFLISYGRKAYELYEGLSLGASLKVIQQSSGDFSALGPGLDLGILWQPILYWDHTVGLTAQNLFQGLYWNSGTYDSSAVSVNVGAAFKFFRSKEELYFNHLIQTIDLNIFEYSRLEFRAGVECWLTRNFGLRAGYNSQEVTAGASYRPENFEIDYAFHYGLTELSNNQHRISLLLRFKSAPLPPAERAGMPELKETLEPEVAVYEDSTPHDDANAPKIAAKVLEIQRVGGKAYKVILNVGANQGIKRGYQGSLVDAGGQTMAGIIVQQVDPKLCLAEIAGVAKDVPNDATAIIRLPVRK
jgi:hypothetical protein